jgi:hypothetical protein
VLVIVLAVLGVPVTVVLVVLVVAVLARLVTAGERMDVGVLAVMRAVLRIVHHRNTHLLLRLDADDTPMAQNVCHLIADSAPEGSGDRQRLAGYTALTVGA